MKVSFHEPDRFVAHCTYDERHLPYTAGFYFDYGKTRKWFTTSFRAAAALRLYFDDSAKTKIKQVSLEVSPWGSRGLSIIPKSQKLDDCQKTAVEFALSRNNSYLAYDAGLGKTPISVAIINAITDTNRNQKTLIVVPPFLVSNWLRELDAWKIYDYKTKSIVKGGVFKNTAEILIIPDSLLISSEVQESLKYENFNLIIVDETQRYLNADSMRTKILYGDGHSLGLIHKAEKRVFLSGTHVRKGPMDLYPIVRGNAWDLIDYMGLHEFGLKYCAAHQRQIGREKYAWDYSGSSNIGDLKDRLYDHFIIQKSLNLKTELIERAVIVDGKIPAKVMQLELAIQNDKSISEIIGSPNLGDIAKYRRALVKVMLPVATDYIKNILDHSPKPLLIYGVHHDMIKGLEKSLKKYKPKSIYGPVNKKDRDAIEKDFQSGKIKVLIASISCMVGINLTKGSRIVFAESSWDYTDNSQAISRAHRRGQTETVLVDHLVLADTIGEYVMKTVLKKKRSINKLKGE